MARRDALNLSLAPEAQWSNALNNNNIIYLTILTVNLGPLRNLHPDSCPQGIRTWSRAQP